MALSEIAKLALKEHLPDLVEGTYARKYGWQVDMNWETGLCHVRLTCPSPSGEQGEMDTYMLQLAFDYYNMEQPGVRFVSPADRRIGERDEFERWWPNVDGNTFINMQLVQDNPAKSYLCFQWTHEFKETHAALADGDAKKWDPNKHSVVGVVRMVQRALNSSHYKGYRKK